MSVIDSLGDEQKYIILLVRSLGPVLEYFQISCMHTIQLR